VSDFVNFDRLRAKGPDADSPTYETARSPRSSTSYYIHLNMLCQTCEAVFKGHRQHKLSFRREVSSTLIFQASSNEEAPRRKHSPSLAAIEASASAGCHFCTILCNTEPLRLAKSRTSKHDEQISYEYVRPSAMEENNSGLIELHILFGNARIANRAAVVLLPSKSKNILLSNQRLSVIKWGRNLFYISLLWVSI